MGIKSKLDHLKTRIEDPLILAATVFVIAIILWVFGKISALIFPNMADPLFPWMVSAALVLFYSMFCAILLFTTKKLMWYWSRSIYGLMGLLITNGLIAYLLTGVSVYDAGSYATIFTILVIAFVTFMTIVSSVRKVVEYTIQRDKKKMEKESKTKKGN